jgi:hypothetical protein
MPFPGTEGSVWTGDTWDTNTWDEDAWAAAGEPSTPSDTDVDQFRDFNYRRRLSWGLGCAALLLMAGCSVVGPPRPDLVNPPCLVLDTGQVPPPCP